MKKYKLVKKQRLQPTTEDIIDRVNAVSATDCTGLIPSEPKSEFEENAYDEVYPERGVQE